MIRIKKRNCKIFRDSLEKERQLFVWIGRGIELYGGFFDLFFFFRGLKLNDNIKLLNVIDSILF